MIPLLLAAIKIKTDNLAIQIQTPADLLPTYGYARDFGYPHVEVDNTGLLHYVNVERGQELQQTTTA